MDGVPPGRCYLFLPVLTAFVGASYFCRGWLLFPGLPVQSVRILPSDVPRAGATSGFRGSTVPIRGFMEEKNPKEAT